MNKCDYFALEGLDGCGKSTLLNKIQAAIEHHGRNIVIVEEPGHHGDHGHLRRIMTYPETNISTTDKNMVRTLLMAADRVLSNGGTRRALAEGSVVLSSRSFMSSIVYQGIIGGQLDLVTKIHQEAGLTFPSIIFVIKVSGAIAVNRLIGRAGIGKLDDIEKQMRMKADDYAAGYDYAESFVRHISGGKTKVIYLDGESTPDDIFAHAMAHIKEHLQWNLN